MKHLISSTLLISLVILNFVGCVSSPETYDNSIDDGVYTGSTVAYSGEAYNSTITNLRNRTCPTASVRLVVSNGTISATVNDTYPNYGISAGVIVDHTMTGTYMNNNQFKFSDNWAYDGVDQQGDLRSLEICEATIGSDGNLSTLGLKVGEQGFAGEYGFGTARGSLLYGVTCTDGRFLPVCIYFMQLTKQ